MPPLVGVAVNVTLVAMHIVLPGAAAMLTDGATVPVTAIVIEFDVAVDGLEHASDDVITTVTTSPLASVELWKVLLLVPAFTPFTFH